MVAPRGDTNVQGGAPRTDSQGKPVLRRRLRQLPPQLHREAGGEGIPDRAVPDCPGIRGLSLSPTLRCEARGYVTEDPLILRPASMADAPLLHAWRNDPQTRRASRRSDVVPWAEHEAWLLRVLASPDR